MYWAKTTRGHWINMELAVQIEGCDDPHFVNVFIRGEDGSHQCPLGVLTDLLNYQSEQRVISAYHRALLQEEGISKGYYCAG